MRVIVALRPAKKFLDNIRFFVVNPPGQLVRFADRKELIRITLENFWFGALTDNGVRGLPVRMP